MKEQQTAPLTTEELTEKYHKLRRTFILATVISIFGTIVMLPSVLFFKIPYALAGALVLLTGESMRYRIKKEMRALAPWILASGVLNETFEDVRYQPSGCLSRETLLESGLPLPEFDAVQGSALVSAAYQGTSFELSNIRLSDPAKGAEPVFQGYCLRCRLGFPLPAELSAEASEDALELLPDAAAEALRRLSELLGGGHVSFPAEDTVCLCVASERELLAPDRRVTDVAVLRRRFAEEMGTVTQMIDTLLTLRPDAPETEAADTKALSE